MEKIKFSLATLSSLEKAFGLVRNFNQELPALLGLETMAKDIEISDFEQKNLEKLQKKLLIGAGGWNEVELESKFIGPLFGFADFDDGTVGYFMERSFKVTINDIELSGNVAGLIAKGTEDPEQPYFCMQEFKRSLESPGRPNGQTLAAMLAAQALNENKFPIYGLYVIGVTWHFMVLEGKEYTISKSYGADSEDLDDIFKMLKALKVIILKQIENE